MGLSLPSPKQGGVKLAAGIGLALVSAFAASLWALPSARRDVSDVGTVAVGLLATVCLLYSADRQPHGRRRNGLFLLMWAVLAWTVGECTWSLYELVLHQETPFPSLADVGYLASIPLFVAAAFVLGPPLEQASRLRVALDGLIMACCTLFIAWVFVLGPVYAASTDSEASLLAGLAYPVGDLLIAGAVLHSASRAPAAQRTFWWFMAAAVALWTASDSAFAYTTANGTYSSGLLLDVGWFAALVCMALAGLTHVRLPAPNGPQESLRRPSWIPPMVASVAATVVAAGVEWRTHNLEEILVWVGLVFVALVLARQAVAQTEIRRIERATMQAQAAHDRVAFQARFLNAAAHELATPLTPLRMDLHRLGRELKHVAEPSLETRMEETLVGIRRQVERLVGVVDDLARSAQYQDGAPPIDVQPADLVAVLRQAVDAEADLARRNRIHVDADLPPSLPSACDPAAMQDAVRRLIVFAVLRSAPGATIHLRLRRGVEEAELDIRDESTDTEPPGDLFDGLGNSGAGTPAGGMGLHLSHGIIHSHGGRLRAQRGVPNGLVLSATLPLAQKPPPEAPLTVP